MQHPTDTRGTEPDENSGLRRFAIFAANDSEAICMGVGCTFTDHMVARLINEAGSPLVFESEAELRTAIEQRVTSEPEPKIWISYEDALGLKLPDERYNGIDLSGSESEV